MICNSSFKSREPIQQYTIPVKPREFVSWHQAAVALCWPSECQAGMASPPGNGLMDDSW